MARLIVVGRGRTAERVAELAGPLGYDEVQVGEDVPRDLVPSDHVVIADDDAGKGRDLLLAAARAAVLPAYLGYAAPHREGWKALVRLAAMNIPKDRIDAISAPAGVDVGAETPDEVAVAVAAELVAVRRGRGRPSAGLEVVSARRRPAHEARPRRLVGGFARPAPAGDEEPDDDPGSKGRN